VDGRHRDFRGIAPSASPPTRPLSRWSPASAWTPPSSKSPRSSSMPGLRISRSQEPLGHRLRLLQNPALHANRTLLYHCIHRARGWAEGSRRRRWTLCAPARPPCSTACSTPRRSTPVRQPWMLRADPVAPTLRRSPEESPVHVAAAGLKLGALRASVNHSMARRLHFLDRHASFANGFSSRAVAVPERNTFSAMIALAWPRSESYEQLFYETTTSGSDLPCIAFRPVGWPQRLSSRTVTFHGR
jgi:hypothetical protein